MAQQFDSEHRRDGSVPMVIELYPRAGRQQPRTVVGAAAPAASGSGAGAPAAQPAPWQGLAGTVVDCTRARQSQAERALVGLIRHAQGLDLDERLAQHTTDERLFGLLTRMDLDQIDDPALVEAAAAADRLEAAAHAVKLQAAAALAGRASMTSAALADHSHGPAGVAGDELTLRLRTSAKAGADLVRRGKALAGHLSATGDALAAGRIDAARARVIVDGLEHVGWEVGAAVESQVLPKAPDRTPAQLRSDVAKALIAVDATAAEQRARERAKCRRVTRPRAEHDETASMRIEGPATDVLALDASARATKAAGDGRTIDQLRFDALAGIGHHALATGHFGDPATGTRLATTKGQLPRIHITMALDQLLPQPAASEPGAPGTKAGASGSAPGSTSGAGCPSPAPAGGTGSDPSALMTNGSAATHPASCPGPRRYRENGSPARQFPSWPGTGRSPRPPPERWPPVASGAGSSPIPSPAPSWTWAPPVTARPERSRNRSSRATAPASVRAAPTRRAPASSITPSPTTTPIPTGAGPPALPISALCAAETT